MKVETGAGFLKVSRDGAEVMSTGKPFYVQAPATRKARRPILGSLTAGMNRSSHEENRSFCHIHSYYLIGLLSRVYQVR